MTHTTHDRIREHALETAGVRDGPKPPGVFWSADFERLMRNRLLIGHYRYGGLADEPPFKRFDNIGSAIARLKRYLTDGNVEHLVDAANLCLVEFVKPDCHPNPSLRPVDDGPHKEEL